MQDEQLRAALRKYLEEAIEQDRELRGKLRKCAHRLKSGDPIYAMLCAHIAQLAKREPISSELLRSLEGSVTRSGKSHREVPPVIESAPRMPGRTAASVSRALAPFERELVETYNEQPQKWSRKYRPMSFGAANVDEIWRSGGDPKFAVKEGGIYHLIEDSGRSYVVPEPGLKLQEGYLRSEGLAQLFEVPEFEDGATGIPFLLVSPAVVEQAGEQWRVREKGELARRV